MEVHPSPAARALFAAISALLHANWGKQQWNGVSFWLQFTNPPGPVTPDQLNGADARFYQIAVQQREFDVCLHYTIRDREDPEDDGVDHFLFPDPQFAGRPSSEGGGLPRAPRQRPPEPQRASEGARGHPFHKAAEGQPLQKAVAGQCTGSAPGGPWAEAHVQPEDPTGGGAWRQAPERVGRARRRGRCARALADAASEDLCVPQPSKDAAQGHPGRGRRPHATPLHPGPSAALSGPATSCDRCVAQRRFRG